MCDNNNFYSLDFFLFNASEKLIKKFIDNKTHKRYGISTLKKNETV